MHPEEFLYRALCDVVLFGRDKNTGELNRQAQLASGAVEAYKKYHIEMNKKEKANGKG